MPALSTARLRLRPFTPGDLPALSRITAQADVMRFIGRHGMPLSEEQTARTAAFFQGLWAERGFGVWALEHAGSGALIGWCGFFPLDGGEEIEVAYLLDRPYWGQGLAVEAAGAALRWAFTEGGLTRVVAVTHPENVASRRVLEKLGLRAEGTRFFYGRDLAYYAVTAAEYRRDEAGGATAPPA